MTDAADSTTDLHSIESTAATELLAAELIETVGLGIGDAASALGAAELGYFEAELKSLREAAIRLDRLPE